MEKDKFQPIVMPCTKEQYESLIPIFEKHNIKYDRYGGTFNGIVNNFNNNINSIGKVTQVDNIHFNKVIMNRKIYQRFNRKIFLKSLGIVEEPEFVLPEKWCVRINNENHNIISEYRSKIHYYSLTVSREGFMRCDGIIVGNNNKAANLKDYTEITFEQFQKYVLKQDISILESQSKTSELKLTDVCVSLYKRPTEHLKDFYDFLIKNNQNLYVETSNEFLNYQFDSFNGPYFGLALGEDNRWMGINNKRKQISISEIKKLILKSQSVTNKQTKTMVKATVQESQPKEKIHKGCLVKWKDIIGVVISINSNKSINIISLSKGISQAYNIDMEIDNVSLFKGRLTLEQ